MEMNLGGKINLLLGGGWRDLRQRLWAIKKGEGKHQEQGRIDHKAKGMVIEVRNIECNAINKAIGGISAEITDLGKGMARDQDKA